MSQLFEFQPKMKMKEIGRDYWNNDCNTLLFVAELQCFNPGNVFLYGINKLKSNCVGWPRQIEYRISKEYVPIYLLSIIG